MAIEVEITTKKVWKESSLPMLGFGTRPEHGRKLKTIDRPSSTTTTRKII
jgi:hypothetical protein